MIHASWRSRCVLVKREIIKMGIKQAAKTLEFFKYSQTRVARQKRLCDFYVGEYFLFNKTK